MRESFDPDDALRLEIIGELDMAVCDEITDRLAVLDDSGPVRIDLSQLEFIDSSGVRTLLLGLKDARRRGCRLEVDERLRPPIRRVVELMRIVRYLGPDEPQAPKKPGGGVDG